MGAMKELYTALQEAQQRSVEDPDYQAEMVRLNELLRHIGEAATPDEQQPPCRCQGNHCYC